MPTVKQWKLTREWTPAAAGSDETFALMNVEAGVRVIAASYRVLTAADAASTMTVSLGDGTGVQGFIANFDPETATIGDGGGTFLANSGGKLYSAADTIDVTYDQTTYAGVKPRVQFTVTFRREWP